MQSPTRLHHPNALGPKHAPTPSAQNASRDFHIQVYTSISIINSSPPPRSEELVAHGLAFPSGPLVWVSPTSIQGPWSGVVSISLPNGLGRLPCFESRILRLYHGLGFRAPTFGSRAPSLANSDPIFRFQLLVPCFPPRNFIPASNSRLHQNGCHVQKTMSQVRF